MLFLRPEEVLLEPEATQQNSVPARIVSAVFEGATVDYLADTPVGEIAVKRLAGDAPLDVGDSCFASWPATSGILLDAEG